MRRRSFLSAAALALPARAAETVDVKLVLAIDISRSIVESDARLQREGYRAALLDPQVLQAIGGGAIGAIAVAYVEWAAFDVQTLLLPWTRIATRADAAAWSEALGAQPYSSRSGTSLSGALRFSGQVLADSPFAASRQVVDVSGDGVNNNGPPAERWRDQMVGAETVINGLPIINDHPRFGGPANGPELVRYYTHPSSAAPATSSSWPRGSAPSPTPSAASSCRKSPSVPDRKFVAPSRRASDRSAR